MNHYAAAWAWALSSPFQGTKQDASHLGGTTDPLVIVWPGHIKDAGGLRRSSHTSTILRQPSMTSPVYPPAVINGVVQTPLEGTSLTYTFDHPQEPTHHTVQYFTTSGNRGIYKDGWWAGNRFHSTVGASRAPGPTTRNIEIHPWELYNLNDDYSQAHNLADSDPEKLAELQRSFDDRGGAQSGVPIIPAHQTIRWSGGGQKVFIYRAGVERAARALLPPSPGTHTQSRRMSMCQRRRWCDYRARQPVRRHHSLRQGSSRRL